MMSARILVCLMCVVIVLQLALANSAREEESLSDVTENNGRASRFREFKIALKAERRKSKLVPKPDFLSPPRDLWLRKNAEKQRISITWKAAKISPEYFDVRLSTNGQPTRKRLVMASTVAAGDENNAYKQRFKSLQTNTPYTIKITSKYGNVSSTSVKISFFLEGRTSSSSQDSDFDTDDDVHQEDPPKQFFPPKEDLTEEFFETVPKPERSAYVPDIIDHPLDVLFMVDRSSSFDPDLLETKCLLRNLTAHFHVAYYRKVRIALMNFDENQGLEFSFRRYSDAYTYDRAIEMFSSRSGVDNRVGHALTYASQTVLQPNGAYGSRRNVAKVVFVILGSDSQDYVEQAARELRGRPYLVTVVVGYGDAKEASLAAIAGSADDVIRHTDGANNLCDLWLHAHELMWKKLRALYSIPLKPPRGFRLGMSHSTVVDMKWSRPDDLVNYYSIQYRPLRMGEDGQIVKMKANVGQEHRIRLMNLDSTEYEFEVVAHGIDQTSPPVTVTFDMACAATKVDALILLDTSNLKDAEFEWLARGFLKSFVDGFVIGWDAARIGIILYANEATYVAPLSTFTVKQELMWRIDQLRFDGGSRNTGSALSFAYFYGFEYVRRDVPKILIVVTNGESNDDVTRTAKKLRADGTSLFYIEVGSDVDNDDEVRQAGNEEGLQPYADYSYFVESYEYLDHIQYNMSRQICDEAFGYYKSVYQPLPVPTNVRVRDIRNTSFEILWDGTESELITGYTISHNGTSEFFTTGKHRTEFTLYDLLPGHIYNVSFQAKGYGKDSATVHVITTTAIFPPLGVAVEQISQGSLHISWQAPSDAVIRYKVSIFIRQSQQMIQTLYADKYTNSVDTTSVYPGYEYECRVEAVYVDDVASGPTRAYIVTDLPAPQDFRVFTVAETQVQLEWKFLRFSHYQTHDKLVYLVRLFDEKGNQVDERQFHNNTRNLPLQGRNDHDQTFFAIISNLAPGRRYNATLQAQMNEQTSTLRTLQFSALRVNLALDVAILFEMAPNLQDRDVIMTREFIQSFANCYATEDSNNVRLQVVQLSNRPVRVVSTDEARNRTLLLQELAELYSKAGTSVLTPDTFKETVMKTFADSRSGVPRILFLVLTNQHYSNLMPEKEDELAKEGITSVILQMSHSSQPPYSNQSMMHRYILDGFDQFNLVLNHAVIDTVRSDEFPLKRVEIERELLPSRLTVYQESAGDGAAEWWASHEWPHHYRISLKDPVRVLWSHNVTLPRRLQLRYSFTSGLRSSTNYTLVLESFNPQDVSARTTVDFRTNFKHRWTIVKRAPTRETRSKTRNSLVVIQSRSQRRNKGKRGRTRPRVRPSKYLKAISERANSCLMAGCNVVFLIDGSNATRSHDLNLLKNWLKRLINSLQIEAIDKAAEYKKRQAIRRHVLHRLPPIATYGVGLSIVQYAEQAKVVLPMMTRLTRRQINQYVNSMKLSGGGANTGNALDFVRRSRSVFGNNSTRSLPTRNIVVLVTSGKSEDNASHQAIKLKREGALVFVVGVKEINKQWANTIASNPPSTFSMELNSYDLLDGLRERVKRTICQASSRRKKVTKSSRSKFYNKKNGTKGRKTTPRLPARNLIPKRGIHGAKGDRGIRGVPGPKGASGLKGERGHLGPRGLPGPPGPPCLIGPEQIKEIIPREASTERTPIHRHKRSTSDDFEDLGPVGPVKSEAWLGVRGRRGSRGYPGVQGHPGLQGVKGEPGAAIASLEEVSHNICQSMIDAYESKFMEEMKMLKRVESSINILRDQLETNGYQGSFEQQLQRLIRGLNDEDGPSRANNFKGEKGDPGEDVRCGCEEANNVLERTSDTHQTSMLKVRN